MGANELACDKKFYDFWQPIRSNLREAARSSSQGGAAPSWDVASILGVRNSSQYVVYLAVLVILIGLVGINAFLASRAGSATAESASAATPPAAATPAPGTTPAASAGTPVPTPIPPTPTPFQTYRVKIANTDGEGLIIRAEPGGERVTALPEGADLTVIGPSREHEGRTWVNVRDQNDNTGWVPEEYTERQ